MLTSVPELALDPSEASSMAEAMADVARWYKIPKFAQKSIDHATLVSVLIGVYGFRVAAYRIRTADARATARKDFEARRAAQANGGRPPAPPARPSPLNGGTPPQPAVRIEDVDKTLDLRRIIPEGMEQ